MLMVLYGNEPYGVQYFLDVEMRTLGIDDVEVIRGTLNASLMDDIYMSGLFGRKYFILSSKDLKDPLIERLMGKEPVNEVRIIVESIDKRLSIYNRLEKSKKLKVFNRLNEEEFRKFCLSKLCGMKITRSDFDYLVERIGYTSDDEVSLYTAEIWLSQLRTSSELITRDDIDFFIPKRTKENAFMLFSHFFNDDKVSFFTLLLDLLRNGENEINLLSTLLYSFRLSYKIAIVGKERAPVELRISPYQVKSAADMNAQDALRCLNVITDGIRSIKFGCDAKMAVILATAKLFK